MVRSGADRARVSGVFEVPPSPELLAMLQRAGIETEEGELLIEREIQSSGKSRALVGNRPATAALLRDLAPFLGDIHGQHDQQQLFSPAVQRDMLDAFAGAGDLVRTVSSRFKQWRALAAELEDLDKTSQEKLRLADLWAFQCKEIETVAPQLGEDAELEGERRILGNVVRLQESAGAAYAALYDDAHSAVAQLGTAVKRLDEVARIDASILEVVASLRSALIGVDEAAHGLRHYVGTLEADPKRLDEVESRLAAIEKIKRKYGATIGEILAFLDQVKTDLATAENSTQRRQEIEKEIAQAAAGYELAASKLSTKRRESATRLSQRVERELAALAMEKTRVEIRVEPSGPGAHVSDHSGWSEHGSDTIRILISPNPGEEPKPLEKIASGGEMSRVALALKTCTGDRPGESTDKAAPLTLVFDEVDAGVGGSAAEAVGRRLKKLSRGSQVLCVTHLPQIAGFADHHYSVEKHTVKGRTVAAIEELTPEARTREIGRMLSGERVTPEALRHAEQLIKLAVE
jgi:DNA repair protein RecN (Recombination protein N)